MRNHTARGFMMGLVVVAGAVLPADGEVASALLRTTDVLVSPFEPIFQFGNATPAVLDNGDFVFFARTRSALTGNDTDYYWGSIGGLPPGILRVEDTARRQRSLSGNVDLDSNGRLVYTANLAVEPLPAASTNSFWVDDTIRFAEDGAFSIDGVSGYWVSFARPTFTPDGVITWKSRYASAPGGDDADELGDVIYQDDGTNIRSLLKTGDPVPGTGENVASTGLSVFSPIHGNWAVSGGGDHLLAAVTLAPSGDETLLRDGVPLTTQSGGLIRVGEPIPAADIGTTGRSWETCLVNDATINDSGAWGTFCETDAPSNEYVLMRSGVIVHREGDVVDGRALIGIPEAIAINNIGDMGFIWDDAVFLNDRLLLKAGDLVDFVAPADGVPETLMTRLGRKLTLSNRIQGRVDIFLDVSTVAGRAIALMTVVDAGNIAECISGPKESAGFVAPSPTCLQAYDFAPADGDVDLQDMQAFQNLF